MKHLALYYYDSCPFCVMVLNTINKLNLKVEMRNILEDESHLQKLVSDTGRRTVPCLYIDGKPMHESMEIMAWLEGQASVLEKNS